MRHTLFRFGLGATIAASVLLGTASVTLASVSAGQQQALLTAHNTVRSSVAQSESTRLGLDVKIPNLTWNSAAASNAQAWADSQIASIAGGGPVLHNPNLSSLGYGENSYAEFGFSDVNPNRAVQFWAGERPNYTYDTNSCAANKVCGHYTQVVWAKTTGVGCGSASQGTWTVWYCDYVPAGNITGQRPYTGTPRTSSPNLIKNFGAESGAGGNGNVIAVPSWTRAAGGTATSVKYGTPGGYPLANTPGPPARGKNFFAGGPSGASATQKLTQTVSLAPYKTKITGGGVKYTASGWFGGFASQRDNAYLQIDFKNASGQIVATTGKVGAVTAAQRANVTKFLQKSKTSAVPKTAVTAVVTLGLVRVDGSYNDAYADQLSLTLAGI